MRSVIIRRGLWGLAITLVLMGVLWAYHVWPFAMNFEGLYDIGIVTLLVTTGLTITKALKESA